ncbi:MAG TPA: helix-turn-helix transcriptional regulator [Vicinamibacteria bacterium]|nr:helix-turn-helix transcriptional regulator [Vicinamibacteria bacterium]
MSLPPFPESIKRHEHGSLYPALHRLERKGWLSANWDPRSRLRPDEHAGTTRPCEPRSSPFSLSRSGRAHARSASPRRPS